MISPLCEKAINEALHSGNALLKFISANDAGATGAHQSGFYMPKAAWKTFTPNPPEKGVNSKHDIRIEWGNGLVTESVISWYGKETRSEYRLTKFGREFPYLIPDCVGDLLVLIPKTLTDFNGYVFDLDEDIEEIIASLGVQPFISWSIYENGMAQPEEGDACLESRFNEFAKEFEDFPKGEVFSKATWDILTRCSKEFSKESPDEKLLECYSTEYRLFQVLERQICQKEIGRLFKDVDDFLHTAASIMNRRKARAGRSLENHVEEILKEANVPHEMQPRIDGNPDIVLPSVGAYLDPNYPVEKLLIVGVKTTCKDRWRQVLNEGVRVQGKHILTLQPSISANQLREMHSAGVTLVVPKKLKAEYPTEHPLTILTVEEFISQAKQTVE